MSMNSQAATFGIAPGNGVMNCLMIKVVVPLVAVADQGTGYLGGNLHHRTDQVHENRVASRLHKAGVEFGMDYVDLVQMLSRYDRLFVPFQAVLNSPTIGDSGI